MILADISQDIQNWALTWTPVFGVLLMAVLVVILYATLKTMGGRTKPHQIKPVSAKSIGWDEIAGVEEAKHELQEAVAFLRDPQRFKRLGATAPKGILLHGPPAPGQTPPAQALAHEPGAPFVSPSA